MKSWWHKASAWLRRGGAVLAGAAFAVMGAGWLWRRREHRLGRLKDEVKLARATSESDRLRAVREELAREVGEKDEAVAAVDEKLAENRRAVVESFERGKGLSDEDVEREFERLGY